MYGRMEQSNYALTNFQVENSYLENQQSKSYVLTDFSANEIYRY